MVAVEIFRRFRFAATELAGYRLFVNADCRNAVGELP